jgi:hypothetical protein
MSVELPTLAERLAAPVFEHGGFFISSVTKSVTSKTRRRKSFPHPRFERGLNDPESFVLPLHQRGMRMCGRSSARHSHLTHPQGVKLMRTSRARQVRRVQELDVARARSGFEDQAMGGERRLTHYCAPHDALQASRGL